MKKTLKVTLLAVVSVLTVIFLCLAAAVLWIQSDGAKDKILGFINQRITGSIRIESWRMQPAAGRLDLNQVVLQGPEGDDLVQLDHLAAAVHWPSLLAGVLRLQRLQIVHPRVEVDLDLDNDLNIIRALLPRRSSPREKQGGQPRTALFALVIDRFALSSADIRFHRARDDLKLNATALNLLGNMDTRRRSGGLNLSIGHVLLQHPDREITLQNVGLLATIWDGDIRQLLGQADSRLARFSVKGAVNRVFDNPLLDLTVESDTTVEALQAVTALPGPFTGPLHMTLSLAGSWQNPSADLDLRYGGGQLAGRTVDSARLQLDLEDRILYLNPLHLSGSAGSVTLSGSIDIRRVFAADIVSRPPRWDAIDYRITVLLNDLKPAEIDPAAAAVAGRVQSRLTVSGRGVRFPFVNAEAVLSVSASSLVLPGLKDRLNAALEMTAGLEGQTLTIKQLTLASSGLQLKAHGGWDYRSNKVKAAATLTADDIHPALQHAGLPSGGGRIRLTASVSGTTAALSTDFAVAAHALSFAGKHLDALQASGRLDESGLLTIDSLRCFKDASRLELNGRVRLFKKHFMRHADMPLTVDGKLSGIRLSDWIPDIPVGGILSGRIQARGSVTAPRLETKLNMTALSLNALPLGHAQAVLRFADGRLTLSSFLLNNGDSRLYGTGAVALRDAGTGIWAANPFFEMQLSAKKIMLQDFLPALAGRLTLDARLSGRFKDPKGRLDLVLADLETGVQHVQRVGIAAELDDRRIHFHTLQANLTTENAVEGSGWIDFDRSFACRLSSKTAIPLSVLDLPESVKGLKGTAMLDISGRGTLAEPIMQGRILLSDLTHADHLLPDAAFDVAFADDVVRLHQKGIGRLAAEYRVDTRDFNLDFELRETRLDVFLKLVGKSAFSALASTRFSAVGNLEDLKDIAISLEVASIDVAYDNMAFARIRNLSADFRRRTLRLGNGRIDLLEKGFFLVEGSGGLTGPLDFRLSGSLPLEIMQPWIANHVVEIKGLLNVGLHLGGTLRQPHFQGDLLLETAQMTVPAMGQRIENIAATLRFEDQTLTLESLSGRIGSGRFRCAGRVRLDGFAPAAIALDLSGHALPLAIPDTLNLVLNTELSINGAVDNLTIGGSLVILEGVYYRDINVNLFEVAQKKRPEPAVAASGVTPLYKNWHLDIFVTYRTPFVIDNNLALLEMTPDIRISGDLQHPILAGGASVAAGSLFYQRRTFTVQKGTIDFVNPYAIAPEIDIQARVQVRHWTIDLSVSGVPGQLTLALSSRPEEADVDIVSLLVLGKTTAELAQAGPGTDLSPAQLTAFFISKTFGEDIKEAAAIDILEVTPVNEESSEAGSDIKVTVGKHLSRRLTVKYAVESSDAGVVQYAISEYKILENILMNGFQNTEGRYGGGLLFRVEFR